MTELSQPVRKKERPVRVKAEPREEDREAALLERAAALEEELAQLEQALVEASYAQEFQRINELHNSYKEKREQLEAILKEWESLARP